MIRLLCSFVCLLVLTFSLPLSAVAQTSIDPQAMLKTMQDLERLYQYQAELLKWCGPTRPVAERDTCMAASLRKHGLPPTFFADKERVLRAQLDSYGAAPAPARQVAAGEGLCLALGDIAFQAARAREQGLSPTDVLGMMQSTHPGLRQAIKSVVLQTFEQIWRTPPVMRQRVETECLQAVRGVE